MSLTTDQSKLFKTDAQHRQEAIRQARAEALQSVGNPVQLPTKPLKVVVRQSPGTEPDAFVAESGFVLRRIGLESGKTKQVFRGHSGPVTSLDFYTTRRAKRELLISGSWDKSFRVWDIQTKSPVSTTIGHTDFIKTVLVIPELDVLVTGSSDKDIRIWDLSKLDSIDYSTIAPPVTPSTPAPTSSTSSERPRPKLAGGGGGAAPPSAVPSNPLPFVLSLKSHTRPIERLAYFPITTSTVKEEEGTKTGKIGLVSTDSMGVLKIWELEKEGTSLKGTEMSSVRHHELAIYDLVVGAEAGEIWTASADNSILLSSFSPSSPSTAPTPILRIPHPTQTRALLPLHLSYPNLRYLLTTTTNPEELIRIFNLDDEALEPDEKREVRREWKGLGLVVVAEEGGGAGVVPGCVREVEGHTNEITSLSSYVVEEEETKKKQVWILSASLDGTIRRWNWKEMLEHERDKLVLIETTPQAEGEESLLTEEEERELEELMRDD